MLRMQMKTTMIGTFSACILVIGCVIGQGTHPGGHFDIQALTQGSFSTLDISPKDGALSEAEWDAMLDIYNSNGDNCTSIGEYTSHTGMPEFVARPVFNELDTDMDGCLTSPEMASKYRSVDTNGNNQVSDAEYGEYYKQVFENIFSHMTHGPPL